MKGNLKNQSLENKYREIGGVGNHKYSDATLTHPLAPSLNGG